MFTVESATFHGKLLESQAWRLLELAEVADAAQYDVVLRVRSFVCASPHIHV